MLRYAEPGAVAASGSFRVSLRQERSNASRNVDATAPVHIIGGGPVGLMLTALLQTMGNYDIRLYEKRSHYTRTRMVKLDTYLVADSVENYCMDYIDGENVEAVFDRTDLEAGVASRQSIAVGPSVAAAAVDARVRPLNAIEQALSDLIDGRGTHAVERVAGGLTPQDARDGRTGCILIDCTGSRSLLRDDLTGLRRRGRRTQPLRLRLEYALVITFLYSQTYVCDEHCKYFKNTENDQYKFIPEVYRTFSDQGITHVTGIVNIAEDEFRAMPPRFTLRGCVTTSPVSPFDGPIHRPDHPRDRRRGHRRSGGHPLPLELYHARNVTSRKWHALESADHPLASSPAFLAGDSAIGSPYFQSISLGFDARCSSPSSWGGRICRCRRVRPVRDFMFEQWMRVYMRSKMISTTRTCSRPSTTPSRCWRSSTSTEHEQLLRRAPAEARAALDRDDAVILGESEPGAQEEVIRRQARSKRRTPPPGARRSSTARSTRVRRACGPCSGSAGAARPRRSPVDLRRRAPTTVPWSRAHRLDLMARHLGEPRQQMMLTRRDPHAHLDSTPSTRTRGRGCGS